MKVCDNRRVAFSFWNCFSVGCIRLVHELKRKERDLLQKHGGERTVVTCHNSMEVLVICCFFIYLTMRWGHCLLIPRGGGFDVQKEREGGDDVGYFGE